MRILPQFIIEAEKTVFDKALVLVEAKIKPQVVNPPVADPQAGVRKLNPFKRLKVQRQNAVVVFMHNTDTDTVILTRQFRYPIADREAEPILELVAGKIDEGEDPIHAAMRECKEETGYKIRESNLRVLCAVYASPGYSSERFHFYYATVKEGDKETAGGGLKEENEYIEVVEMKYDAFMNLAAENQMDDAKTLLAALYVKLHGNYGWKK